MGKISLSNLKKTMYYMKRNGLRSTISAASERLRDSGGPAYQWEPASETRLQSQREQFSAGFSALRFSIVVPTYRTPKQYLRELLESVLAQTYGGFELILADASGDDGVKRMAEQFSDDRIRYVRLSENRGISDNTNEGLRLATGDYVGLLDHDDVLTADALFEMARGIEEAKKQGITPQLLYSDEDKCNGDRTKYYEPNLKEDFNQDLLLCNNYICHFLVMKRELIQRLELRREYDGAQDFDLVLRAVYELDGREADIVHIPRVLYHWRCHGGSTAENPQSKLYAYEAGRRAVQAFVDRKGWKARVEHTKHLGFYRVDYDGDIFGQRPEIGAIGGPVLCRGRIVGGRMTAEGEIFYRGLPASYSGYLHRAVLAQQAEALDIRNMRVRGGLQELLPCEKQQPLQEKTEAEKRRKTAPGDDADQTAKSLAVSREIRRAGYKLLYLPEERTVIRKSGGRRSPKP